MINPILSQRVYFLAYMLTWIMLSLIQVSLDFFVFQQSLPVSLVDGFLINILRALAGLAVWYPVRFNPFTTRNFLTPVINIIATGIITIAFWATSSYFILTGLFMGDEMFRDFLQASVPYRVVTDFLYYVVLVLVYSLMVYSNNLKEKISNESNLRTLVREAELNMLKAQINPHFLFNSLNSISLLTVKDPGKAREMIIKLSEFLRYSLRFNEKDSSRFGEELESMDRYLEIEKIRFGERLDYSRSIGPGVEDWEVPNMILQPILENAIKHGVYESTEPIKVALNAVKMDSMLRIIITNNYDATAIPRKGAGIGLKNIRERLALVYGRYDLLSYEGKEGIFTVDLRIPEVSKK
jgi:sensor histidine kinase YesM